MAISATNYHLLCEIAPQVRTPMLRGATILEIGQANWYGDAPPSVISPEAAAETCSFAVVRRLYEKLFTPEHITSIDGDPSAPDAVALDLNTHEVPAEFLRAYSLVINHGTAEHIFNIANVFRVMHDACAVGGLMIHESPFTGWTDHGFWNVNPTAFWDVAAANGYEMVKVAIEHLASQSIISVERREQILDLRRRDQLPDNSMLWVAMRKVSDAPFKVPMQGVYGGTVSNEAAKAWRELR
jgi:hypothetical protein